MAVKSLVSQATIVVALATASLGAQAQATISINAQDATGTTLSFAAGTYNVSFLDAFYDAYTFRTGDGILRTTTRMTVDGVITNIGLYEYEGGPWATAAAAVAAANAFTYSFTTAGGSNNVTFVVNDTNYADNQGGVSLAITAVPEPGTYALMLAGLAAVGFVARRRRDA